MNSITPLVSIYTCVYNGARTLHRVFESVKEIDYPYIEHVIVNDGSTDDTEKLVLKYKDEVKYPVKYFKKENGGKHTALNVAWREASGEFLIQLDADDKLYPNSISFLVNEYYSIPQDIREQYWCVHGRFVNQNGDFVGDKYPDDINSFVWTESGKIASKCRGDKNGIQLRKYLAAYQFPEVVGASHIPESIIWSQINRQYGTWYTNEVVGVYYVGEGNNLTAKKTTRKQFASFTFHQKWKIMNPQIYGSSIKTCILYSLGYFVTTKEYRKNNPYLKDIKRHRLLLSLIVPVTAIGAFLYRLLKKIR